jgi:hypothetical protein
MTPGEHVMQAIQSNDTIRPRRRWLTVLCVGIVLLTIYAGSLAWVTRRLQVDIQKSIHPVPAVLQARHPE